MVDPVDYVEDDDTGYKGYYGEHEAEDVVPVEDLVDYLASQLHQCEVQANVYDHSAEDAPEMAFDEWHGVH